ncbi:MAG: homocysteine S-methyltransferase family protein [Clostridia bacterium]|nr:homocysteine S-methyltransferase family protein [Clostridia bacterium]
MKITEFIKNNTVVLDGGMGTLLQSAGLSGGELPEMWNISHPEVIRNIHKDYLDAGCNVISTNTFGANIFKFTEVELERVISSAVDNARWAVEHSRGEQGKWIALDIGPSGKMLKPLGDLDFEDAVSVFAKVVKIGARLGVDLIFIETMADSYETKAALLAAKENSSLPVFVSNAYGSDGKLMTGASPAAMVALLEGMGADAIGINCSLGPRALYPVVDEYLKYSSIPVIFKPNAGLPRLINGKTVYDISADSFGVDVAEAVRRGVRAVGGCCGTTPEYISAVAGAVKNIIPVSLVNKKHSLVSSYSHAVEIGDKPVLIGERINPTGKPKFREAVKQGNVDHILREAISQEEHGAHILDVNLGVPGINEDEMLIRAVEAIQQVCDLPLQIDSADPVAMESALRRYNGKAMINSVNGKHESLEAVLPLAKKYGGVIVALTLDEQGIPATAEGRVEIAKRILSCAEKYGINKKDIIIDPLVMAVSADKNAATEVLRAVRIITHELGAHTSLGISNVSFGLPQRELINSTFFASALTLGLSAAIMNPYSDDMMRVYHSHLALSGMDEGFEKYISFATNISEDTMATADIVDLKTAIIKGLKDRSAELTRALLQSTQPMDIVNNEIIPALNTVGDGYENRKIYLPGLLMSAEAAGAAFDVIKSAMPEGESSGRCRIVMATVRGDIHDIGKNIVKMVLENYGFAVIDLGKDVSPEKIADEVVRVDADILGISALMTTTLPAMEETVNLVKRVAPKCKIMVGGAVLTEDYAKQIGADFYGKDAMDAVRFAQKVNNK